MTSHATPRPGTNHDEPTPGSHRRSLAVTRASVTHKFQIMGSEGYLTVGLFENGQPGEIFIKMAKEGSTLSGLVQGFCRAFSLAIQYGLPLNEACRRFKDMRFEPMGHTSNPDIPEARSIIDYVARYLELNYVDQPAEPALKIHHEMPQPTEAQGPMSQAS